METAHIVVSAKLLSSPLSRHYRCRIVYGWRPPPVQLRSGGTFLAGTKLVQEMNLEKVFMGAVTALGLRPPPLITVSSAVGSCDMFTMNSAFWERRFLLLKRKDIPRDVILSTLTA